MIFVKLLHVSTIVLSLGGFVVRGGWLWLRPDRLRQRWVKVVPHVVDTLLLASGVTLAVAYGWNPLEHSWLGAKVVALPLYILLGAIAFRATGWLGGVTYAAALGVFAYIITVAVTKQPFPL